MRRILCTFFITALIAVCIPIAMFFTTTGRDFLLTGVTKYFQYQNIVFSITGLNKDITKIKEIFIRTPSKIELIFSDISLSRKNLLSRSSVRVEKFILNGSDQNIDIRTQIKQIIPLMRSIRTFIADLSLGIGYLHFSKTYTLDQLKYKSENTKDKLYSKIDNKRVLDVDFDWIGRECTVSCISFEDIAGFYGIFRIIKPEQDMSNFNLTIHDNSLKVSAFGRYDDFMSDILIENARTQYKNHTFDISGNLYLKKHETQLKTIIKLDDFVKNIHPKIKSSFTHVASIVNAHYKFNKDEKSTVKIDFVNADDHSKNLGKATCYLQKDDISIRGDIGWIENYGFQFKKIDCKIKQLQKINLHIIGNGFDAISDITNGKNIVVNNATVNVKNCGLLQLKKAFVLNQSPEYSFDFKFSRLDFLNKLIVINGDASGNISYKNDHIVAECKSQKLKTKDCNFNGLKISIDDRNIALRSREIIIFGTKISDTVLSFLKEKLNARCKTNNGFNISVVGKISESYKKVSLEKLNIDSANYKINMQAFDLNFEKKEHKIFCEILDRQRKGSVNITQNGNNIIVQLNDLRTGILNRILDYKIPKCRVNGDLKLKSMDSLITGIGNLKIYELISRNNVIDISLEILSNVLKLKTNLINGNEYFKADIRIPISIRTDRISYDNGNMVNCHLYANAKLENLIEFSDKMDARGLLNCDVTISGNTSNPQIKGDISLKKAYFMINDIILKNGTIHIGCKGNSIEVIKAEFIDSRKNKATVSGSGKFLFDSMIPNINANFALQLSNFTLFDSDSMKIVVDGNGNITGKLNDLLISGNVKIPQCHILNFSTNGVVASDDITIENENYVSREPQKNIEKDFCRYDIKMNCPNIYVIGKVFELHLGGNLLLSTYNNKATLIGPLKCRSGKLDLFGKRMKITKTSVEFFEQYPFEPKIQMLCKNNFGDIKVYLKVVSKPGKEVSINLYSIPNNSQDAILSNIMFGKNLKYLSVTEAAHLAHTIASFKSNGYLFSILNTFQKIGIIDSISFSDSAKRHESLYTNEQTAGSQQGTNISAGKYIHDNMYISVNKTRDENMSFDVDLSVTENLSVKANTNGAAGLSWKYRF